MCKKDTPFGGAAGIAVGRSPVAEGVVLNRNHARQSHSTRFSQLYTHWTQTTQLYTTLSARSLPARRSLAHYPPPLTSPLTPIAADADANADANQLDCGDGDGDDGGGCDGSCDGGADDGADDGGGI